MTGAILSLKENMEALKSELSSEEKFFESAIKTERFVKKYQKPLLAAVAAVVIGLGGYVAYDAYASAKIEKANGALNTLLMNPQDKDALKALSENSTDLFELYSLSQALKNQDVKALSELKKSHSDEVADIAEYESAVKSQNIKDLEIYSKKQNSLYGDLATIEIAVKSIEKGDVMGAHASLSRIQKESSLYPLAQMLSHYGVK